MIIQVLQNPIWPPLANPKNQKPQIPELSPQKQNKPTKKKHRYTHMKPKGRKNNPSCSGHKNSPPPPPPPLPPPFFSLLFSLLFSSLLFYSILFYQQNPKSKEGYNTHPPQIKHKRETKKIPNSCFFFQEEIHINLTSKERCFFFFFFATVAAFSFLPPKSSSQIFKRLPHFF
jgi:hypothetical protein